MRTQVEIIIIIEINSLSSSILREKVTLFQSLYIHLMTLPSIRLVLSPLHNHLHYLECDCYQTPAIYVSENLSHFRKGAILSPRKCDTFNYSILWADEFGYIKFIDSHESIEYANIFWFYHLDLTWDHLVNFHFCGILRLNEKSFILKLRLTNFRLQTFFPPSKKYCQI